MNRILAIVAGLALAGSVFAAEPAKTEPAKTESAAPAKSDAKTESGTPAKTDAKKATKPAKGQPKGRTGQMKGGALKSQGSSPAPVTGSQK